MGVNRIYKRGRLYDQIESRFFEYQNYELTNLLSSSLLFDLDFETRSLFLQHCSLCIPKPTPNFPGKMWRRIGQPKNFKF